LYLMDTDGRVVRTLYSGSGEKHGVSDAAFSPDGTRIAYQTTRAPQTGTYVVAVDGRSKPRQLTVGADADPAWSPVAPGVLAFRRGFGATAIVFVTNVDGKDVACAGRTRPNELGGGRMCQLTGGSSFDQDPSWSPTGEQIAVKHTDKAGTSIQIVPADGKAPPQPLWAGDPGPQNAPAWTSR
jgi:Tol biopolymer transport system component